MRTRDTMILTATLLTTAACAPEGPAPIVRDPIDAPIAGDLDRPADAPGCAMPMPDEEWTYVWDGDRLRSTAFVSNFVDLFVTEQLFEYSDAGLTRWTTQSALGRAETTFTRDEAGVVTRWTRSTLPQEETPLEVTVTRGDGLLELHMQGQMFLGFESPLLIDLDRIDPELPALSPRLDLILPYLERVALAEGTEDAWQVLDDFNGTQKTVQTADGATTTVDVNGDGAPDVIEQVTRQGEATQTTVDFAIDARIEITIEASAGRTERVETDAEGVTTRTVTLVDPAHVFVDRVDERGEIQGRTSLFFDDRGARTLKYEDDNADGKPNWRKRYINDPVTGFRVFDETDGGASGRIDLRRAYERDADGRVLRATLFRIAHGDCGIDW